MPSFIQRVMHPEWYHGHGKRPPFFEGWYFTPDRESSKIVSTELGRIGVGICNDNQTCWFLRAMTRDLQRDDYRWELGQVRHPILPTKVTYLFGLPQRRSASASA